MQNSVHIPYKSSYISLLEQLELEEADMKIYLKLGIVASGAKLGGDKVLVASTEFEIAKMPMNTDTVKETAKAPEPVKEVVVEKKPASAVVGTATKGKSEEVKKK